VIVPGGANEHYVDELNVALEQLAWVLLIVTSDEERLFPVHHVRHDRMCVWAQYLDPEDHRVDRGVPIGYAPGTREALAHDVMGVLVRDRAWFFAGQVNQERRQQLVTALRQLPDGDLLETPGFAQGVNRDAYTVGLVAAKVAPAPAGHVHVDSFRLYEALEAGCVPIGDRRRPPDTDASGWWDAMWPAGVGFPLIDNWAELPGFLDRILARWPAAAAEAGAWWMQAKRDLAWDLGDALVALGAEQREPVVDDLVTVLVPTSPIPSHPSLAILEQTLASIRVQLPSAEIIVMADGVRPEQEHHRHDYEEYVRQVVWACHRRWPNVVPMVQRHHVHQANTTRDALELVRTPLVLFVEHDTPLVGAIEWDGLAEVVLAGDANAVRFHYDETVHPEHQPLMVGPSQPIAGHRDMDAPWGIPTVQWSQRPHLASADWYRRVLAEHFPPTSRTMIEDKLHGVIQDTTWDEHRVWVYDPEARPEGGGMKRSTHLDGRGEDPKFDMVYE